MTVPLRADVAHVVAKLVARRATRMDELPELMLEVETALRQLTSVPRQMEQPPVATAPAPTVERPPRALRPRRVPVLSEVPSEPPPAPRLLRRADVVGLPAPDLGGMARPSATGALRGVVKWFDQRLRRGALRLPGRGDDVPIEPSLLDEMGVSRLYKGQEIEATLSADETPRVVKLAIPGEAWQVHRSAGVVHNRHAKPVVVELRREAMRRAAARAEAEIVLGPTRAR
jgi:hypothetical protein